MSPWLATTLLSLVLASAKSDKLDAQMLLDLELLSDESFAAHAEGERRARAARDSEMLDKLDWLDEDDGQDSDDPPDRSRR